MARLPVDLLTLSNRDSLPSAQVSVQQADAGDFGGQIGQALGGLAQVGSQLAAKIKVNQDRVRDFGYEQQFTQLDDMALLEALNSDAFYIGALGSRRNQATRKARLAEHFDLTEAALARLHGPVGLQLGAQTPAEIAVSIVAEVVQVKNTVAQSTGEAVALSSLDIADSRITACALT